MSEFTKGKWEVGQLLDGSNQWVIITNRDTPDEHIAAVIQGCYKVVAPMQLEPLLEQTVANARLIAAAPEMYDELYEALQLLKGKSLYNGDEFSQQAESIQELLARIDGTEATHD